MNYNRINTITGWVVCLIACTTYILTTEAKGSLWDCGEFIAGCYKIQVPHPPGAPLFILLGRMFILLFGNEPAMAAKAVNVMSALASGGTILFLFWTITWFARRIVQKDRNADLTIVQSMGIIGAGTVGALAYTFSDSFWFSAVEGEVYALSSFFTALVFWAILKWENKADEPGADKWIVFIFFMIGLSIGVHLLNLLTIPALVTVYYFRRWKNFNYPLIRKYFLRSILIGGGLAFILSLIIASGQADPEKDITVDGTIPGLIIAGILGSISLLLLIERRMKKNKVYYGGAYIFFVIGCALTGFIQLGVIQYSVKVGGYVDVLFVNSFGLPFFSGFAFFFLLMALGIGWGLHYAKRKGRYYLMLGLWSLAFMLLGYSSYLTTMMRSNANTALDIFNVDNPMSLAGYLGRDQYGDFPILYGQKFTAQPIDYAEGDTIYEKAGSKYKEAGKKGAYVFRPEDKMIFPRMWDMSNDQNHADYYALYAGIGKNKDGSYERPPDFIDNLKYFLGYQNWYMYWRYFLWNFSGRQNDVQWLFSGNVRDGNWITGISFIDKLFYGDQAKMPDSLKNNKAHNRLFALPLILGLIGFVFHFKRRKADVLVLMLLFFFTGLAIVIYINQSGFQPRERDYAYVGSFYAYAIWIGLGVLKIIQWGEKWFKPKAATVFGIICLLGIPVMMAQQEWDDHDRSHKTLAFDVARNYLESCAPNAILFTFADNDTYPLWYVQEVEGVRPDVRIVITTLLAADWCIDQLRYKVNQSNPIDVIWSSEQIRGKRDVVFCHPQSQLSKDPYLDLYDTMKNVVGNDANLDEHGYGVMPTHNFSVPVDVACVKANGTVNASDIILPSMRFTIPKNTLYKNELAILNIIAANNWKRPVYFSMPYNDLGFGSYLRKDGLAYRLVPVEHSEVNTDYMLNVVMHKFGYGNAQRPGVYFDEENRRQLNIIRRAHSELAIDLINKNRNEDARKVLERADIMMLQQNFPYGMASRNNEHDRLSLFFLQACYASGDASLAAKVYASVYKDLIQQKVWYDSLSGDKAENMQFEEQTVEELLKVMNELKKRTSVTSSE